MPQDVFSDQEVSALCLRILKVISLSEGGQQDRLSILAEDLRRCGVSIEAITCRLRDELRRYRRRPDHVVDVGKCEQVLDAIDTALTEVRNELQRQLSNVDWPSVAELISTGLFFARAVDCALLRWATGLRGRKLAEAVVTDLCDLPPIYPASAPSESRSPQERRPSVPVWRRSTGPAVCRYERLLEQLSQVVTNAPTRLLQQAGLELPQLHELSVDVVPYDYLLSLDLGSRRHYGEWVLPLGIARPRKARYVIRQWVLEELNEWLGAASTEDTSQGSRSLQDFRSYCCAVAIMVILLLDFVSRKYLERDAKKRGSGRTPQIDLADFREACYRHYYQVAPSWMKELLRDEQRREHLLFATVRRRLLHRYVKDLATQALLDQSSCVASSLGLEAPAADLLGSQPSRFGQLLGWVNHAVGQCRLGLDQGFVEQAARQIRDALPVLGTLIAWSYRPRRLSGESDEGAARFRTLRGRTAVAATVVAAFRAAAETVLLAGVVDQSVWERVWAEVWPRLEECSRLVRKFAQVDSNLRGVSDQCRRLVRCCKALAEDSGSVQALLHRLTEPRKARAVGPEGLAVLARALSRGGHLLDAAQLLVLWLAELRDNPPAFEVDTLGDALVRWLQESIGRWWAERSGDSVRDRTLAEAVWRRHRGILEAIWVHLGRYRSVPEGNTAADWENYYSLASTAMKLLWPPREWERPGPPSQWDPQSSAEPPPIVGPIEQRLAVLQRPPYAGPVGEAVFGLLLFDLPYRYAPDAAIAYRIHTLRSEAAAWPPALPELPPSERVVLPPFSEDLATARDRFLKLRPRLLSHFRLLRALAEAYRIEASFGPVLETPDGQQDQTDYFVAWAKRSMEAYGALRGFLVTLAGLSFPKPLVGTADERRMARDLLRMWRELMDEVAEAATAFGGAVQALYSRLPDTKAKQLAGILHPWAAWSAELQRCLPTGGARDIRHALRQLEKAMASVDLLCGPWRLKESPLPALESRWAAASLEHVLRLLVRRGHVADACRLLCSLARTKGKSKRPSGWLPSRSPFLRLAATLYEEVGFVAALGYQRNATQQYMRAWRSLTQTLVGLQLGLCRTVDFGFARHIRSGRHFRQLVAFVKDYGGDLFTVRFLERANLEAIARVGPARYLKWLAALRDSPRSPTLARAYHEATAADRLRLEDALGHIVHALLADYTLLCEYQRTAPHADYGNLLYVLLAFLQVAQKRRELRVKLLPYAAGAKGSARLLDDSVTFPIDAGLFHRLDSYLEKKLRDLTATFGIDLGALNDMVQLSHYNAVVEAEAQEQIHMASLDRLIRLSDVPQRAWQRWCDRLAQSLHHGDVEPDWVVEILGQMELAEKHPGFSLSNLWNRELAAPVVPSVGDLRRWKRQIEEILRDRWPRIAQSLPDGSKLYELLIRSPVYRDRR